MPFILNIDTATENAMVSLASQGKVLGEKINGNARDHAAWIHIAIRDLLAEQGLEGSDLSAIAVLAGPGSYTGLRVGMATAKGLCFALDKKLITLGTLPLMARAAIRKIARQEVLYIPMLDARRMEVYTAVYNHRLDALMEPGAMILQKDSFATLLGKEEVVFFGDGAAKWKALLDQPAAFFENPGRDSMDMAIMSFEYFQAGRFADIAYCEPFYLKDFHYIPQKK